MFSFPFSGNFLLFEHKCVTSNVMSTFRHVALSILVQFREYLCTIPNYINGNVYNVHGGSSLICPLTP